MNLSLLPSTSHDADEAKKVKYAMKNEAFVIGRKKRKLDAVQGDIFGSSDSKDRIKVSLRKCMFIRFLFHASNN